MRELNGMSVLITGGGSGLGAGTAKYLADRGARVTICGRRPDKLERVAAAIGENCTWVSGDVTVDTDRRRVLERALAHGRGLDALINNAGNMLRGPIGELREADILALLHSNVVAAMMLTGLAVPHLEKARGAVVFIGSIHTRRAFPGASPYAASKAAVEGLSQVLAAELGPKGIRVNCVLPGAVPTEINIRAGLCNERELQERMQAMAAAHPLGRIGTEDEIAEAIAYLLCAQWTTGSSLVVDGGLALGSSTL